VASSLDGFMRSMLKAKRDFIRVKQLYCQYFWRCIVNL